MDYRYTKFGIDSSSQFSFTAWIHTHTHTHTETHTDKETDVCDHLTHTATMAGMGKEVSAQLTAVNCRFYQRNYKRCTRILAAILSN